MYRCATRTHRTRLTAIALLFGALSSGAGLTQAAAEREPVTLTLKVGDLERTALVYAPATSAGQAGSTGEAGKDSQSHPLVFVFHGHGGNSQQVSNSFNVHNLWPEAIVAYPQGVPTPGRLTDPEGKRNGWQHTQGDHDDRDLKFFDALLAKLKSDYRVDEKRIYCTGHSNGGGFTFLLWINRGDVFAAVAPSAAAMNPRLGRPKPLPVIELAGENDPLVKYDWQKATMAVVRQINGCQPEGKPSGDFCTEYASPTGTPFVAYIHPGGHQFPRGAAERFVEFFQQHAKP
jgi:polyhydroxybutyrate depolymerase